MTAPPAATHPQRDEVSRAVRAWLTESDPDMGYLVEAKPYGFVQRSPNPTFGQAILTGVSADNAAEVVFDIRDAMRGRAVTVSIDDNGEDDPLHRALLRVGCLRRPRDVFLAHVGPVPNVAPVEGLFIEEATATTIREFSVVKLKAFASSEREPAADEVDRELAFRHAEMRGSGRFLIGRIGAHAAGILAYYEGTDRHIFLVATRTLFRRRGLASALLCHVLADGAARGCRSHVINADPDDTPIALYRRLGFTDEIWARRLYTIPRPT